jgi:hypothetical protein
MINTADEVATWLAALGCEECEQAAEKARELGIEGDMIDLMSRDDLKEAFEFTSMLVSLRIYVKWQQMRAKEKEEQSKSSSPVEVLPEESGRTPNTHPSPPKVNKMRKVASGNTPIKHNKRGQRNTPHPHKVYRTTH